MHGDESTATEAVTAGESTRASTGNPLVRE